MENKKHLETFESKNAALNKEVYTPYVAVIEGQEKIVYGSPLFGESGILVKDLDDDVVFSIPELNDEGYVDFGLPSGKKWDSCNLGATSPCESGNYYTWGGNVGNTKYNWDDEKMVLDYEDDDVYLATNGEAHMPTKSDFEELIANTNMSYCTCSVLGGEHDSHTVNGLLVVSKTDETKKIFIPATGYYMNTTLTQTDIICLASSTNNLDEDDPAFIYSFVSTPPSYTCRLYPFDRYGFKYCVRGVKD